MAAVLAIYDPHGAVAKTLSKALLFDHDFNLKSNNLFSCSSGESVVRKRRKENQSRAVSSNGNDFI